MWVAATVDQLIVVLGADERRCQGCGRSLPVAAFRQLYWGVFTFLQGPELLTRASSMRKVELSQRDCREGSLALAAFSIVAIFKYSVDFR